MDKKQQFNALDIVESRRKEMRSLSYLTSMIDIFLFLHFPTLKLNGYYYYFADRPTRNNSPDCPYNKKLSCLGLMHSSLGGFIPPLFSNSPFFKNILSHQEEKNVDYL